MPICREKVDLTQYIEEHLFAFDQVFDEYVTNEQVKRYKITILFHLTF